MDAKTMKVRRQGIGATDIAAIVGVHPYKSALDVYAEKLNLVEPQPDNDAMWFGREQEDTIAKRYKRDRPNLVYERLAGLDGTGVLVHPLRRWLRCSLDRLCRLNGDRYVLECKTAGLYQRQRFGPTGTDEVPEEYLIQVAWQMAVTDLHRADLAALLAGPDYREFTFERDMELEGMLIEAGERFWKDNIEARKPPKPGGSPAAKKILARLYPKDREPLLQATAEQEELLARLREKQKVVDTHQVRLEALKNEVKALLGDAEGIEGPGSKVTWKCGKDSVRPDWQRIAQELADRTDNPELLLTLEEEMVKTRAGSRRFLANFAE